MTNLNFFVKLSIVFSFVILMVSCGSKKDIEYFQNIEQFSETMQQSEFPNHEIRIMPNDNLLITVSTPKNPLLAEPYNTINLSRGTTTNLEWQGYLVDENGYINFPGIGKLYLKGLTKAEAVVLLQNKLAEYVNEAIVNIRFMNYKIAVLGEVSKPGTYFITDERISIPDALAKAGDMTIYGQRKDVLVCRVENGEKKFYNVDMTSPSVFLSEAYYLQQNDIIYVKPNKSKSQSASVNPLTSTYISVASLLIGIATLVVNLTNK